MFTQRSLDLSMLMLQRLTVTWLLYTISWVTKSKQKTVTNEHWQVYVPTCYDNLDIFHRQLGDLKQAKEFHERALDVYLKISDLSMKRLQRLTVTWVLYTVSWVT